jgi:hypothetical protein
VPLDGGVSEVKLGIVVPESFRSGPPNAPGGSQQKLWKTLWKRVVVSALLRANWNVSANCTTTGRARRRQPRDRQNLEIILQQGCAIDARRFPDRVRRGDETP